MPAGGEDALVAYPDRAHNDVGGRCPEWPYTHVS